MSPSARFRVNFRVLRHSVGASQEQVARRLHRTHGFLSRIETGTVRLDLDDAVELAAMFGFGIDRLTDDTPLSVVDIDAARIAWRTIRV